MKKKRINFFVLMLCLGCFNMINYAQRELKSFENQKGLYGVKDGDGKIVLQPIYHNILVYDNGIIVQGKDAKYYLIDIDGNPKSDKKYRSIDVLLGVVEDGEHNMYACRVEGDDGKYGAMLSDGKEIIPTIYDEIYLDDDEQFFYVISGSKEGIIGIDGNWVFPLEFDNIFGVGKIPTPEGGLLFAKVRIGIEEYLVDGKGNILKGEISMYGNNFSPRSDNNMIYDIESVYSPNGKKECLRRWDYNVDSLTPISANYKNIGSHLIYDQFLVFRTSGLKIKITGTDLTLYTNGKCGIINLDGQEIRAAQYDYIGDEYEEKGAVAKGNIKYQYFLGQNFGFYNDFPEEFIYSTGGKWGAIGRDGKEIIPLIYDKVLVFPVYDKSKEDGYNYYYACKKGTQWQIFDEENNTIGKINAEYLLLDVTDFVYGYTSKFKPIGKPFNLRTGEFEEED